MSLASGPAARRVHPNRWAVFAVGLVCQVVFSAAFLGLPAASAMIQRRYDLSAAELALFLGAASLAVVLTEAPWGVAADRFGERRVLLVGIGTSSVALIGSGAVSWLVPGVPVLVLAVMIFVAAAAGGAVTGPSGSAILGWFDARRHGTLVSLRVAAVPLGGALGTVAYSVLFSEFGGAAAFASAGVACAVIGVLVLVFAFDPPKDLRARTTAAQIWGTLRNTAVQRVAASGFMLDVTQFVVLTFTAAALNELFSLPLAAGLTLVTVMQLAGGALRVLVGAGTDFVPWVGRPMAVRVLSVIQILCLLPFLAGSALPSAFAVVLLGAAGVAGCAWQGAHFAHIAKLAGAPAAGTALGLNNAATSSGAFIAQIAAGGFAIAFGWPAAFVALGAVPALIALLVFPGDAHAAGGADS